MRLTKTISEFFSLPEASDSFVSGLQLSFAIVALVLICVFPIMIYFFPSLVTELRNRKNSRAIFLVNLFFGWTIVGWIAALIWGASDVQAIILNDNTLSVKKPPPVFFLTEVLSWLNKHKWNVVVMLVSIPFLLLCYGLVVGFFWMVGFGGSFRTIVWGIMGFLSGMILLAIFILPIEIYKSRFAETVCKLCNGILKMKHPESVRKCNQCGAVHRVNWEE